MNVQEAISKRRSVRDYKDEEIPADETGTKQRKDLEEIISKEKFQ